MVGIEVDLYFSQKKRGIKKFLGETSKPYWCTGINWTSDGNLLVLFLLYPGFSIPIDSLY